MPSELNRDIRALIKDAGYRITSEVEDCLDDLMDAVLDADEDTDPDLIDEDDAEDD
jgi:hypothetical protein